MEAHCLHAFICYLKKQIMTSLTTVFFIIGCIGLLAFGIAVCMDYGFGQDKNKSQEKTTEKENQGEL